MPRPLNHKNEPRNPLNWKLTGPHSPSGLFVEKRNSVALVKIRSPDCLDYILVPIPTDGSRLLTAVVWL